MVIVNAFAAVVAASGISNPQLQSDTRVAVVVGSNAGLADEGVLEHAEADARRMLELLTRVGAVRADRADLVISPRPRDVVRALDVARGRMHELSSKSSTTFIFYVSAHADERALHLNGERLDLRELRKQVEDIPADLRLIIIDACRTPPIRAKRKGGRPGPPVEVMLRRDGAVRGTVVISATGTGSPAQEWDYLRGGLFTHHLMTGMRGVADFDGDGRISLVEAYTYAYRLTSVRSAEESAFNQRPSFDFDLRGHGQWTFTRPPKLGAELILSAQLDGDFWITDLGGRLVAEIPKRKGDVVRVALLPDQYRVLSPSGSFARAADFTLTWGGKITVDEEDLVRVPASKARLRGGERIVPRPWRLMAGYGLAGFSPVSDLAPLHVIEIGIERTFASAWALRFAAGATAASRSGPELDIHQQEIRFRLGASWESPLWILTAGGGMEIHPRLIFQQVRRDRAREVRRVFGIEEPNTIGTHLGLSVFTYLRLPLVSRLSWTAELAGGVLWSRDPVNDGLRTGPLLELRTNVGWSL